MICRSTELGTRVKLPPRLGDGGEQTIYLRNGLTIQIRHATLLQPINLIQQHDCSFPLTAKFYLSGYSRIQTPNVANIATDYEEMDGYNYLYHLPDLTEIEQWPANQVLHVVMLFAEASYFSSLIWENVTLPKSL